MPQIDLVLEGGGVKGLGLVGAISVDTMNVRATDVGIDTIARDQLYEDGRKAATEFLAAAAGEFDPIGGTGA